jgi:hypothetical protein
VQAFGATEDDQDERFALPRRSINLAFSRRAAAFEMVLLATLSSSARSVAVRRPSWILASTFPSKVRLVQLWLTVPFASVTTCQ